MEEIKLEENNLISKETSLNMKEMIGYLKYHNS